MTNTNEEALLEATKALIAIESTAENPKGLRQAYEFVKQRIYDSGKAITVEEFESSGRPSLLAYIGSERPKQFHIILNGHLDVVPGNPDQYQAYVKDEKLYGRGAYDMKAAAIVLTDVFCEFVDRLPYPLALQIVTDEEDAGKHGTLHQVKRGVRGEFVICGECGRSSGNHEIANQAKGILVADLAFRGSSAHGAYPWKGDNAAMKAVRFLHLLHEKYPVPNEATSETTITVTFISASGGAKTRIPDYAKVRIDARYTANDPAFRDKAALAAFLKKIHPEAEITKIHDFSSPLHTDPGSLLLLSLKASAERVEGTEFKLATRSATSDGRFFGDVGNEACEFGIAGENQHADDEYITLDAFRNYHATMRDFLQKTI